jgi:hypothetical protein
MFRRLVAHFFRERVIAVIDPWHGCNGFYVAEFRRHLDDIAAALSVDGAIVHTRFNPESKCAELFETKGDVLASVQVHGEVGTPEKAIVTASSLSETAKAVFVQTLLLPVKFCPA